MPSIDNRNMLEDHFRLAEYFRDLSAREQALAKSYDRIAKGYREKTLPPGLDPASARELKNQYKRLAETERKAAEAAATVAGYHARMAELVERFPLKQPSKPILRMPLSGGEQAEGGWILRPPWAIMN